MIRLCAILTIILAFLSPAQASNPGEPLDCSDWVIVEPGISVSTIIPFPCPEVDGSREFWCRSADPRAGRDFGLDSTPDSTRTPYSAGNWMSIQFLDHTPVVQQEEPT